MEGGVGDSEYRVLGFDPERLRRQLIAWVALATSAAVAMCGVIGFVGLLVPHVLRMIWGPDHRLLLPASALAGAALLIGADAVARVAVTPAELPIGVITALVGGPFFLWLLLLSADRGDGGMNPPLDWRSEPFAHSGVLDAQDVHLSYGNRHVLRGVTLRAHPGRLLVLVGPNGAGKSSLLQVLAGLYRPSQGEVSLDGRSLADWSPMLLAQRRAMLSQNVQLGFAFRVEEVVLLGRSPHGSHTIGADDRRIVGAALQAVQAMHLRERNYLELSGGEQQRVQLARVLAQVWERVDGPAWLLLDEPEAGLDIAHQHHVLRHARTLAQQGFGVIAVLHDLNLAARYADDIALLARGQLLRFGRPKHALDPDVLSRVYGISLQRSTVVDNPDSLVILPAEPCVKAAE